MSEAIQNAIEDHASSGLFLVVLLAWLEYVFPPAPGDSTMLFAFFLAGRGTLSLPAVAAAALSGSVLGAMTAYAVGARLGRSYFFLRSAWARRELARIEHGYARHGARFLLLNRFLPGVRGFFLYAAGIGGLRARAVLIHSTVSNVLWIALLAWGGTSLGSTWEEVRVVFRRYVWGIAIFLAVYVVLAVVRARRRSVPVTPSS
ncbi:MAG TPA: DedA family protein [Candidatus Dormibacteraeota bacterium]|nr:DedA family protein [Candidatus Dormibacteraeota bacterium]